MKLSHHLASAQRKKLNKFEAAYEVYQVCWLPVSPLLGWSK